MLYGFTPTYHPTVPVGCEEQIGYAKCTRPSLPVEGLVPRLYTYVPTLYLIIVVSMTTAFNISLFLNVSKKA